MPDRYDRQTIERLHQHLARAHLELQDAQHVLNAGAAAEEAEMDLVHDVAAARRAVTSALERVRSRLGVPSLSEATPQPGRESPSRPSRAHRSPENPPRWLCRRPVVAHYPATSRRPLSADGGSSGDSLAA
jgi:hypothetical protein